MGSRRHHLRLLWVAFAAIVGSLSVAPEASAGPVSRDRAAQMLRDGCCCITPGNDCCCESAPIGLHSGEVSKPGPLGIARTPVPVDSRPGGGSCECRSSDPARPPSNPSSRPSDDRSESGQDESPGGFVLVFPPSASLTRPILPHGSPPRSPLYLRTSRLLI